MLGWSASVICKWDSQIFPVDRFQFGIEFKVLHIFLINGKHFPLPKTDVKAVWWKLRQLNSVAHVKIISSLKRLWNNDQQYTYLLLESSKI